MSFNNIECKTINFQSVAGISAPIVHSFLTGPTGFALTEPNLYLMVQNVTGVTGVDSVILPAPSSLATGVVSTIVCADGSTLTGPANGLLTVVSADSSTIYGLKSMGASTPAVLQFYNGGSNWTGI